jgi:hypothetical protein
VTATGNQILYDFSLIGPGMTMGRAGMTLPISLTILNNGPAQDSYTLAGQSGQTGWGLEVVSPTVTLGSSDFSELPFNITISPDVTGSNVITIFATSQSNQQVAVAEIEIHFANSTYLPIILRQ